MEVFKHCKCVIMRNRMQARHECSLRIADTSVRALQGRDYDTVDAALCRVNSGVLLSVGFATLHLRLCIMSPLRGCLSFSTLNSLNNKHALSVDMEVFKHSKCVIMRNRMQARNECSLRLADTSVRALQGRDYDTIDNAALCRANSGVLLSVGFATLHLRLCIMSPLRGCLSFSTLNLHTVYKHS